MHLGHSEQTNQLSHGGHSPAVMISFIYLTGVLRHSKEYFTYQKAATTVIVGKPALPPGDTHNPSQVARRPSHLRLHSVSWTKAVLPFVWPCPLLDSHTPWACCHSDHHLAYGGEPPPHCYGMEIYRDQRRSAPGVCPE